MLHWIWLHVSIIEMYLVSSFHNPKSRIGQLEPGQLPMKLKLKGDAYTKGKRLKMAEANRAFTHFRFS